MKSGEKSTSLKVVQCNINLYRIFIGIAIDDSIFDGDAYSAHCTI